MVSVKVLQLYCRNRWIISNTLLLGRYIDCNYPKMNRLSTCTVVTSTARKILGTSRHCFHCGYDSIRTKTSKVFEMTGEFLHAT